MRVALVSAGVALLADALLISNKPEENDDLLTPPEGIAFTGDPASVICEGEVDISKKEIFATIFGCGADHPAASDNVGLCQPYMKGGCDNEVCQKFCHKNYISHNEYMDCKCLHWGDKKMFKDYCPGAPCPLKVQPRCYKGNLYRSQCEAQQDNPDVSIDKFTSVKDSEWPEGDMSAFIPSPVCPH